MISIETVDLTAAERDFVVANTPMFLARRLQSNPVINHMAQEIASDTILQWLKGAASTEPQNVRDSVIPYVLIVSLFLKGDLRALREATLIVPHAAYRWFDYIRTALIQLYKPIVKVNIKVLNAYQAVIINSGNASTTTACINVRVS
jgi:hypothetical protein